MVAGLERRDLGNDGQPATQRWSLQMKEDEDATEEPFDIAAFAQEVGHPYGRQAGTVLLPFGIPEHGCARP